ncbi:hypothetical protein DAEQUDRAFT_732603 [Daedalea quercina L-15889]|uniref:CFEM domain-containing protein n=1 Tax=Daedalea quercina L-15889 TaxID=1314783 RepID=A0A165LIE2_9APHY|nr:hypothetical protein DAEQUDRAFT_732603 [Daedalea quercina L-15889]
MFKIAAGLLPVVTDEAAPECFASSILFSDCPRACWDIAAYGRCSPESDASCLCNEPLFVANVSLCIENICSKEDVVGYEQLADELCATVVSATSLLSMQNVVRTQHLSRI